jgi:alkanesulfonate monooxygenase SsuD/methylene tetrahydromethanopterin reductase-like flavin-dependent oxidoreductase (luciferase family)
MTTAERCGPSPSRRLAVSFSWHQLAFEELRELVRQAETRGYEAAYVDGDVSVIPSLGEREVLDGWTVTTALLAETSRIAVTSIRLVHHWNAARLAQSSATLARLFPGRTRLFVSIGGQKADRRFGLALPPTADRIAWLDESLAALRRLWRGEEVSSAGRFVVLEGARVRPALAAPPPIEVGARSPRLLRVVAAHADAWNVNLPPLAACVAPARACLAAACRALGRSPEAVALTCQVFARPGEDPADPALLAAYRRFNPWFGAIPDAELARAIVAGEPADCRRRLDGLRQELGLALPIVDLTGLPCDAARRALDALAPG